MASQREIGTMMLSFLVISMLACVLSGVQVSDEATRERAEMARTLAEAHNTPNPFNASTSIQFKLTQRAYVVIDVYDVHGRWILRLFDQYEDVGEHKVAWKTRTDPTGSYFFRLTVEDIVVTGKMCLIK